MLEPLDIDGKLTLDPPLVNASGAVEIFGIDPDWTAPPTIVDHLGGYVTKSVTLQPIPRAPEPRIEIMGAGTLVNAVALAGPGIDGVAGAWPAWEALLRGRPCIVSIAARGADEFELMTRRLEHLGLGDAIELNLSCPNHGTDSLVAADPQAAFNVVEAARGATDRALLVKLSPACGRTAEVARAVAAAGADAIVAVNTMPVRAIDGAGHDLLASPRGGMSGTALHAIALRVVEDAVGACDLPVIGVGGIDTVAAAQRMFEAGARAVGLGTGAMLDDELPGLVAQWIRESSLG